MVQKWSTGLNAVVASVKLQKKPQNEEDVGIDKTFREKKPRPRFNTNTAPISEEIDGPNASSSQPECAVGENATYYQGHAHNQNLNINNSSGAQYQSQYINTSQQYVASGNEYSSAVRYDVPPPHMPPSFQGHLPPTGQDQTSQYTGEYRPTLPRPSYSDSDASYAQGPILEEQAQGYYEQRPFEAPQRFHGEWQGQSFTPNPGQVQRAHTIQVAGGGYQYVQRPPDQYLRSAQTWHQAGGAQDDRGAFEDVVNSAGARSHRGGQYWGQEHGQSRGNW